MRVALCLCRRLYTVKLYTVKEAGPKASTNSALDVRQGLDVRQSLLEAGANLNYLKTVINEASGSNSSLGLRKSTASPTNAATT